MRAKDVITVYVYRNADGSIKVPMAIIGKVKNPRSFRLSRPPVPYFSQQNAWSDREAFRSWLYDLFLTQVRSFFLLMNNSGPPGMDLGDINEQVKLLKISANCTDIQQPLHMEIISAWKIAYRGLMLRRIVKFFETRQKRRDECKIIRARMKGWRRASI